jgi:F-type H+-transporting ATPase subunit c
VRSKLYLLAIALSALATPLFAQPTGAAPAGGVDLNPISAVIGMAIASGLCGLAQGKAVAGAAEAMARNPGARGGIQLALILGLVLIESLALYTFAVVFLRTH